MNKRIISLIIVTAVFLGCSGDMNQGRQTSASGIHGNYNAAIGSGNALAFDPSSDIEALLPEMSDLPVPASLRNRRRANEYTGIIKNKTNYDVSVPSGNSGANLVIPAKGFIEYTSWLRQFDLTAYYEGKPFYCLKINAHPQTYAFMCRKYDFIAEIVKAEPREKPLRKKKVIKKKKTPTDEGVEGFG
jgi:hypothetical protein